MKCINNKVTVEFDRVAEQSAQQAGGPMMSREAMAGLKELFGIQLKPPKPLVKR